MKLILASSSPRRSELLRNSGYDFTVIKPDADESAVKADAPQKLVESLALLKAKAVWNTLPAEDRVEAVVLGADTVVVLDGNIIGKPRSYEEAKEMLKSLSGREHRVFTGVAVIGPKESCAQPSELVKSDVTSVRFAELPEEEIEAYIATGEPMDKAGAYGVQGSFCVFIEELKGSYFNVVGLPVHTVYKLLKRAGIVPRFITSKNSK